MNIKKHYYAADLLEELIQIQKQKVKLYSKLGEAHYPYKREAKEVLGWLESWRTGVTPAPKRDSKGHFIKEDS